MKAVTMQDVADRAGVSPKTVSRVVNNEPRVSESTRKKIEKVIDELSFKPNKSAQSLAADRSLLIGLLYDNPSSTYVVDLQAGVLGVCNKFGYGLVIHPCENDSPELIQRLRELLVSSRMDGLILTPPMTENQELLDFLVSSGTPYVLISPLDNSQSELSVSVDDSVITQQAIQSLIDFGHRRIGFITGLRTRSGSEMRLLGYQQALEKNNISYDESLIVQGNFTFGSGVLAAQELLRHENPPTAIFASNDYMAAGVMKAALQLRISIPHELSLCGFDDTPVAGYMSPGLTTIRHPLERLASHAGELLIRQLKKHTQPLEVETLKSELILRGSTGPVNNKTN
jgi:LacI family transcriptional regulator